MFRVAFRGWFVASIVATLSLVGVASGQEREASESLVVHEWGTFTSLQDELGNAIGGINSDDEPVPGFVHRVADNLIVGGREPRAYLFAKSVPRTHPDVTMRLETPVVYFHPGPESARPLSVDIGVEFRGGWLSEFYPRAEVDAPGAKDANSFGPLTAATVGRLAWNKLQVGTDATGPETDSQVWLAPRAVDAANVTAAGGESERYLFYRGVGRVDSPLRISHDATDEALLITAAFPLVTHETQQETELVVPALWLVDVDEDKRCAFRRLDGIRIANDGWPRVVARTPATFDDSQFSADNIEELCSSMRKALVDDGLYADEADALLQTWRASYFESAGLRLFYLLPREWTDHVLPMTLSVDARLVRTMIGRVEIVTPEQRRLLREIAAGPPSNAQLLQQSLVSCAGPQPAPPDYRAYQSLGRFRNALILDELERRRTEALQSFVDGYGLAGYAPSAAPTP